MTVLLAAFVMLAVAVIHAPVAAAWNNTRADGQAWAANFCATPGDNYFGLGDFMWPSATDGGSTVYATYGDTSVNVRITVTGRYCPGYASQQSGSSYYSSIGGVSGSFTYGNNGANNTFDDSQVRPMNIAGWGPGVYRVCMVLATWSVNPNLLPVDSPSQCADLTLVIKYPWSTDGMSQVGVDHVPNVSSWPAQPGQTVTWNHGIWNTSAYATNQITAAVERSGFSAASGLNGNQYPYWPGAQFTLGPWGNYWFGNNTGNYNNGNFSYQITQDDVGAGFNGRPSICQYASWGPWWYGYNWGDPWKATTPACVQVPYNFKLTPTVNAPTDTVEPGTPIGPINPTVSNSGPTKSYDATQWQLSKFIVGPGGGIPATADINGGKPCDYYKNGCANIGSGNQTFAPGDSVVGALASYTVDDAPSGSRICFALSVTGYDAAHQPGSGWWRNGVPTCIMIGKKPKLQVWGGDVATRAGINVSLTQKTTGVYGSWVEYGAFSVGTNGRFASGAGLSPVPTPQTSAVQNDWSKLTFANVSAAGSQQFGLYSAAPGFRPLPSIAQYFSAVSNKAAFVGTKPGAPQNTFPTGGAVQVMTAGDLTLQGDTIPVGRSVVIVASGTVTITGDITYDNKTLKSLSDLPQLVIIAKNINITSGVSNVDAWLVTSDTKTGVVDTCSDVAPPLADNVCNNLLTIHGPVAAGELHLKRTGGSGAGAADSGTPAEVINLRPDAYLWAQLVASGAGKAQTVYTTELPPRF